MIEPAWQSSGGRHRVYLGDCVDLMRQMPERSVRCCVTSPPYWGLRDYGTADWDGGDPACDHTKDRTTGVASSGLEGGKGTTNHQQEASYRDTCGKCGARRVDKQLGLEPTPDEYVAKMVEVFREVRRVLADDGTLWLNLGDSYASKPGGPNGYNDGRANREERTSGGVPPGLKPKDLVGIPWRVAFALQADGWYLRQDIVWQKPNPMPESVRDRCTKSHEYIFLLSKNQRYYFDAEAIAEPAEYAGQTRGGSTNRYEQNAAGMDCKIYNTRNKRSVWTVNPAVYPEAHFATYPPKLIEPCILAGSAPGDTVLDPFTGSGTTGAVAAKHGRRFVGCELNPDYIALAGRRIDEEADHLFAGVDARC